MIRNSLHTSRPFNGTLAGALMRTEAGWMALVCVGLEGLNYQTKQDRSIDPQKVI